jgi:class 3 adenylate cyclase
MSEPTKVSRRLVAVFAADVAGYSRLMGADEVGTLKGLTERRAILDRYIANHGGRIARNASYSHVMVAPFEALYPQASAPWFDGFTLLPCKARLMRLGSAMRPTSDIAR